MASRARALGLRGRMALLVGFGALPALALTLNSALEVRARAEADADAMLKSISQHQAQVQEQVLDGARQTLVALALPLRGYQRRNDAAGCRAYLAELMEATKGLYHSVGLFRPDGMLFCNAVPYKGTVLVPDRGYFRLAREHRAFSVGEYQVGRVTGKQGINLGYPVAVGKGALEGIAFLGLDVEEIGRRVESILMPEGVMAIVEDARGVILASHAIGASAPKVGEQRPESAVRILEARRDVGRNADGRPAMRVHVSIPYEQVVAEANRQLKRNLALLGLATLFVAAVAWIGTSMTVVPRLRALLRAAHRVREGDLTARTGLPDDNEELARVGIVFDRMAETLERRDAELKAALHALREQSITDSLTGLYNRRHMEDLLARDLQRVARGGQPLSVVMVDADHFKRVNDTYGHDVGDEVLRRIAALLKGAVRGSDVACRFGGEEFLLLLPGASGEAACARAEAIREAFPRMEITVAGKRIEAITASMGVATYPADGRDARELFKAADEALYRAKEAGRDRVMLGPR